MDDWREQIENTEAAILSNYARLSIDGQTLSAAAGCPYRMNSA